MMKHCGIVIDVSQVPVMEACKFFQRLPVFKFMDDVGTKERCKKARVLVRVVTPSPHVVDHPLMGGRIHISYSLTLDALNMLVEQTSFRELLAFAISEDYVDVEGTVQDVRKGDGLIEYVSNISENRVLGLFEEAA